MKVAPREAILAVLTGFAALYAATFFLLRPQMDIWQETRRLQESLRAEIARDRALVEQRAHWEERFVELSRLLPALPQGQPVEVYWLSVMDRRAVTHGVEISRRQAGEETRIGDVYELPIQVTEWEATLSALVHFLFDLQAEGAMFDIRELFIRPKSGSLLRGRFQLSCAYTRAASDEE